MRVCVHLGCQQSEGSHARAQALGPGVACSATASARRFGPVRLARGGGASGWSIARPPDASAGGGSLPTDPQEPSRRIGDGTGILVSVDPPGCGSDHQSIREHGNDNWLDHRQYSPRYPAHGHRRRPRSPHPGGAAQPGHGSRDMAEARASERHTAVAGARMSWRRPTEPPLPRGPEGWTPIGTLVVSACSRPPPQRSEGGQSIF